MFDLDTGILGDLQQFSSDTQQFNTEYASLAAQLIATFTGDKGAKRTTWEQQFARKIAGVVGNDSLDRWFQSPENQKTFLKIMNETVTAALEENNEILKNNRYPDTLPQEEEGYVDNIKGGADSNRICPYDGKPNSRNDKTYKSRRPSIYNKILRSK